MAKGFQYDPPLPFDADEMIQKAVAESVGVTRQTIIAIENAKYSPTLELAFQIAEVLGKPLRGLFTYEPQGAVNKDY